MWDETNHVEHVQVSSQDLWFLLNKALIQHIGAKRSRHAAIPRTELARKCQNAVVCEGIGDIRRNVWPSRK